MALGALSVCLTVMVLNLHHRDNERPVPAWAQTLVLNYLASLLCVVGNQLHRRRTSDNTDQNNPPATVKNNCYTASAFYSGRRHILDHTAYKYYW